MRESSGSTCSRRSTWWRTPRRSAVARLDPEGRLTALDLAGGDEEIAGPRSAPRPGVAGGRRPPERARRDAGGGTSRRVLAWCDVAGLPGVAPPPGAACTAAPAAWRSRRALARARAARVRRGPARPGAAPDRVGARPSRRARRRSDLAEYRAAWLGVRAPVYRPKGAGRARPDGHPAGLAPAGGVIDLGGWAPDAAGRRLGASSTTRPASTPSAAPTPRCAWRRGGRDVHRDAGGGARVALPADANLAERVAWPSSACAPSGRSDLRRRWRGCAGGKPL